MPSNAETTQTQLILAAEELFGAKGVDGVSLREINALAGQKNTSAVRYHFGDKAGIIDAILRERMTILNAHRLDTYNALIEKNEKPSVYDLVELVVRPLANKVLGTEEEPPVRYWRNYIRLLQKLATVRSNEYNILIMETDYNAGMLLILRKLDEVCADIPEAISEQRRRDLVMFMLNSLCERVVAEDKGIRLSLSRDAFLQNMLSVGTAIMTAPISQNVVRA